MNPQPTLIEEDQFVTCARCEGSGAITCGTCDGMGQYRPNGSELVPVEQSSVEGLAREADEYGLFVTASTLRAQAAEIERLNARNVEVSVLAHAWMVAHDMRAAGMPVTYPARADVPALTARVEALEGENKGLSEDAERFRALMRCGRIKMQGSSGVDPHTNERNGNNVHFGAEFWPEPPKPEYAHLDGGDKSTAWGRACLRHLADAVIEAEARAALNPLPNPVGGGD